MPVHNIHIDKNSNKWMHMWLHNAYGSMQQNATYAGLWDRDQGKNRPFVLSRSFWLGSQRYSGFWTGDSQTNFENVEMSVNQLLTLGLTGQIFGGCDIPGFYGEPSDDLFVQFYQLGIFYPFFRAHNNIPRDYQAEQDNFSRREPWLQSARVQEVIKKSIAQRYAQIHYLYTAFWQANQEGLPIFRPLWMEFPTDTNTFGINNQFMWGDNFLIAPKLNYPTDLGIGMVAVYNISLYLPPAADWYLQHNKQIVAGSSEWQNIIVGDNEYATFIKAGSVIPILNFDDNRMSLLQAI